MMTVLGIACAAALATLAAAGPATAAQAAKQEPRTFVPYDGQFDGAAVSAGKAWAVGPEPVAQYWNGKAWAESRLSKNLETEENLPAWYGVAAVSARSAWAVGFFPVGDDGYSSLIAHWSGGTWTRVPSPTPGTAGHGLGSGLTSVAAASATNAWAVGSTDLGFGVIKTLILHWNGKSWAQVPSPNPGGAGEDSLYGVAIAARNSAWAVGTLNGGNSVMILHWNGARWLNSQSANELG